MSRGRPISHIQSWARFWFCVWPFLLALLASAASDVKLADRTIERTIQLRTHSIHPPYINQDLQNRWWDFGADAYINTNKHIRLTRRVPSQMGWLWSRLPITPQNFVVEVEFKVSGESSHLYGDGMAMWFTSTRAQPGPVFGSIDKFEGLGIFLDTYANGKHDYGFPRISAMLGDGATSYDYGNDGEGQTVGACSADFRRSNVATKLKVTYLKESSLDVKIQYKGWDEWTDCFKVDNVKLPLTKFLGFSAMTGDVADAHDIVSVTSYSAFLSSPDAPRDKLGVKAFTPKGRRSSGGFMGFLFKLVLIAGVAGAAWAGWRKWNEKGTRGGYGAGLGYGRGGHIGEKRF